jgi:hypothetical protein
LPVAPELPRDNRGVVADGDADAAVAVARAVFSAVSPTLAASGVLALTSPALLCGVPGANVMITRLGQIVSLHLITPKIAI